MRIALVVPHIFMHKDIINDVIFAPGQLSISLARGLAELGHEVTLVSPGYKLIQTKKSPGYISNINADLSFFEAELSMRGDGYLDLLKKHPLTFITLARQVQSELIADTFKRANNGEFDLVHIYMNEEELGLIFSEFCNIPVVFTHHEPFNFLAKYRSTFPRYKDKNWISISLSQQKTLGLDANFIANIYHGIEKDRFEFQLTPKGDYLAYFGRIIEPKGVHLAIHAAKQAGVKLKIAGKHYSDNGNDSYWSKYIEPELNDNIEYIGFINSDKKREEFLGNAKALLVPSTWDEPFGMVMIEALACGTPIIGLDSGAIPEVIKDKETGFIVQKSFKYASSAQALGKEPYDQNILDTDTTVDNLVNAIKKINQIKRLDCRKDFEERFTAKRMAVEYSNTYKRLL